MKDTYWYVLAAFCVVGGCLWVGTLLGRSRAERLQLEGRLHDPESIWTRDLLNNRFGRIFVAFILSPILVVEGVFAIIRRHARWKYFDYQGADAAFIGVGEIGLGILMVSIYPFPLAGVGDGWLRKVIMWCGLACIFVGFSVALFRNI